MHLLLRSLHHHARLIKYSRRFIFLCFTNRYFSFLLFIDYFNYIVCSILNCFETLTGYCIMDNCLYFIVSHWIRIQNFGCYLHFDLHILLVINLIYYCQTLFNIFQKFNYYNINHHLRSF